MALSSCRDEGVTILREPACHNRSVGTRDRVQARNERVLSERW